MDVRIEQLAAQRLAYVRGVGAYGPETCGKAFRKLMTWLGKRGLADCPTLGIAWDDPKTTPPEQCRYDACAVLAADQTADGDIAEQTLPEGLYAICRVEIRDDEFAATWQAFCAGWLPSSGYRPAGGPSFERYLESRYQRGDGRWLLELCIPIQPR